VYVCDTLLGAILCSLIGAPISFAVLVRNLFIVWSTSDGVMRRHASSTGITV